MTVKYQTHSGWCVHVSRSGELSLADGSLEPLTAVVCQSSWAAAIRLHGGARQWTLACHVEPASVPLLRARLPVLCPMPSVRDATRLRPVTGARSELARCQAPSKMRLLTAGRDCGMTS